MATIVTINSGDLISNSRADLNTNFTNLNSDKIETSYIDTDTALAANSDTKIPSQKAVKAYIDTSGGANASETVRGIVEEATDAEVTAGTATGGTGAKLIVTPAKLATRLASIVKFGGTGADGALSITSGATNIDLGSATVVVKNYTSISITGTGSLTFTNPASNGTVVVLKSQGAVTLTSSTAPMIVGSGNGSIQESNAYSFLFTSFGGANASSGTGGTGGAVSALSTTALMLKSILSGKYPQVVMGGSGGQGTGSGGGGAGGGGGSTTAGTNGGNSGSSGGTPGLGGRGGGVVVIECAGALNFTTASGLSANGVAGTNASGNAGGGGGGAGGTFLIFYNTLTANSGTITVAGQAGGTGVATGGTGGNGYSLVASNTEFL